MKINIDIDLLDLILSWKNKIIISINNWLDINSTNDEGYTLLHFWSIDDYWWINIVNYLLREWANPNIQTNKWWTPLDFAVQDNNSEIVTKLLEEWANPNIKDNYWNTSLWRAIFNAKDNKIIEVLLKNWANYDPINNGNIWMKKLLETISVDKCELNNLFKKYNINI